jgi:hypothetical protein
MDKTYLAMIIAITALVVEFSWIGWSWRHDNIHHYQCVRTSIQCCYKGNAYEVCEERKSDCDSGFCQWKKRTWAYISGVSERK